MSKTLVLAMSGFGKSTSIGHVEDEELDIHIKGVNPDESYVLSMTTKPLPFPGSKNTFPITTTDSLRNGRRILCKSAAEVESTLVALVSTPVKNIILDDFNYIMQDWYMDNALSKGWDAPKTIGFFMGKIFRAIESLDAAGKNVIVLAHGEPVLQLDGRIYMKLKTTGKMVDEYITPEGKFDVTLLGVSVYDTTKKKVTKQYLTNENDMYSSAKSPIGMFKSLFIPNDLGIVVDALNSYY